MASYSCFTLVQTHLVSVIDGATFHAKLPEMSEESWDSISDANASESRRLEWLGDSAMAGRLSLKVYEMFPEGEVDFYNLLRSYVLSNVTFTHLMQKIGTDVSIMFPEGKMSADVFEMVVGAFFKEKLYEGYEHEFHEWFDDTFEPLITAADAAFRGYKRWEATIPDAPVVPTGGTMPAVPTVPLKKKKKKAKRHEKAVQAVRSYRHLRSIEEKRRAELARLTVTYVPPPPLPQPAPIHAPAPTRYDHLFFSLPPLKFQDHWDSAPLLKLRTSPLSPTSSPAQDDGWYLRPLPEIFMPPTFST
ncbi:hypothetical protein C8F04DRAFT_1062398 [Mycena alexandri]|uniref:RNase III domain-containing protein n=1 Tax=Mycena alexandri TaxID=1745969 RepID=A0AAD6XC55_9AGAR|nr:hypothetical protein C8F04DRAFT_1062398 [Mycena alexandri]